MGITSFTDVTVCSMCGASDLFIRHIKKSLRKLAHEIYGDFSLVKIEKYILVFFLISAQNIDRGYVVLTSTHNLCFGPIIRKKY